MSVPGGRVGSPVDERNAAAEMLEDVSVSATVPDFSLPTSGLMGLFGNLLFSVERADKTPDID